MLRKSRATILSKTASVCDDKSIMHTNHEFAITGEIRPSAFFVPIKITGKIDLVIEEELLDDDDRDYEPYSTKESFAAWMLFIVSIWTNFGCGWTWSSNFATQKQTELYYNIDGYKFRVLNEIFLYVYTITGYYGTYLAGKNLKLNMIFATVLISIGSIIVYFSGNNYWVYLLGNFFCSLSQAHLFSGPATIADRYFSLKLNALIQTIPTFVNMLGGGVGLWIPAQIFNDTTDMKLIGQRMNTTRIVGMVACVPSILCLLPFQFTNLRVMKKFSLELEGQLNEVDEKFGFAKSLKAQFTNKYCLLNYFMGIYMIGLVWVFISISNTTMADYLYADQFVGFVGFQFIQFGSICGIVFVKAFEIKIDLGIKIMTILLTLGWGAFTFIIYYFKPNDVVDGKPIQEHLWFTVLFISLYCLIGGSLITNFGLIMNSCVEICYPIQESVSTGNILITSQCVGFQFMELLALVGNTTGHMIFVGGLVICLIVSITQYETKNTISKEIES